MGRIMPKVNIAVVVGSNRRAGRPTSALGTSRVYAVAGYGRRFLYFGGLAVWPRVRGNLTRDR